ncbi:carbon-nitrogen hydrolase family protein [Bosea sp. 117]|uniref:carbon-nitrogen hydrolase family protein n=1 Tax=Bosea sp. 117 TaxID=1125973 RepID=UPI0004940DC7|nr:carbon-nitrogen hydrolase family protein [Bosea sp. 117]
MRLALLQTAGAPSNAPADNLDRLEAAAAHAAAGGADLLVAPEMFLTGYAIGREAAARHAEPADGPSARRAAAIARQHHIALAYGYPERGSDGRVYNAALLVDAEGRSVLGYRKTHLFGAVDREMFAAGETLGEVAVLALPRTGRTVRIGMLICYDVEFPEAARTLALAGAELILVPTANMPPCEAASRVLVPARACENGLFVAYANRCGGDAVFDYYGESCVAGPDGRVIALAGGGEEIIFADLDFGTIAKAVAVNAYLRDRRAELYG